MKALALIGLLAVGGLVVWVSTQQADAPGPVEPAEEQVVSTVTQVDNVPEAPATDVVESQPIETTTGGIVIPDQPVTVPTLLAVPYSELVRSSEYVLMWAASKGTRASIVLEQNGSLLAALPECTNMDVVPGTERFCTWVAGVPERTKSEGLTLVLRVFDAGGALVDEKEQPITYVTSSSFLPVPHENRMYGWSVRYPEHWRVVEAGDRTYFVAPTANVARPLSSDEAFTVETCSLARQPCVERVETFAGKAVVGTVAGKRSEYRIYPYEGGYVREDLILRESRAYFVARRALTATGLVHSTFVRESVDTFGFEDARLFVETYELNESFRAGSLLVELVNNEPMYARLVTGARGCATELTTDSFVTSSLRLLKFTKGSCLVSASEIETGYEVDEERCESLHTGECTFDGTYELVD